jgi:ATP-dependent DNA helicase RecQ
LLLRSYANLLNNYVFINELELSKRYNVDVTEIKRLLIKLQQLEIVKYQEQNSNPQLTFIKARKDVQALQLNEVKWKKRKEYEKNKLNRISDYIITKKTCRSKMLLHYFGEENSEKCGVCDVCVLEKRKNIKDKEFLRISNKIKEYLQKKEHSLEEICTLLPNTNEQEIINILNFLFVNDKVGKYGNKYQWKG